ncbi:Short chain dehydrogenase [Colletotrichum higginsianum IMI 349063]|uniref:Short chain dehydrogenase n=3 Tax=Colletotrichum higginsianum TaxID=80884 RepID=A0A1B7YQF7_COLHI|nr:Short chain dehydrogenase [Colletotrichum higginsianum IMI 349063]OBR14184.1 Short chain dehydrogenase [Colletotrichum higginsianum IMI 349063]TID02313.1 Hydroxysteroid dehydrogenase-like protein 2 [Colletotrichum higginsianum]
MAESKPVALVVGASRGIGRQIAIDLARNGYAVVVAAKTTSDASKTTPFPPDPNSQQSTVSTVAREIREAGGDATPVAVDVRHQDSVERLIQQTIEAYARLDVLVYNSGAIWWASVEDTPPKRFQLMQRVNPEGLYLTLHAALPHLRRRGRGRVVVVSPPIYSRFFRGKTAYAMGKVAMSVLTKGLAMDFARQGLDDMAITSIWPAVAIESAATQKFQAADPRESRDLRRPTIFSDAVLAILRAPAAAVNGELLLDEDFLRDHAGVVDFSKYALVPGAQPRRIMPAALPDLTVAEQDDEGKRYDSAKAKL